MTFNYWPLTVATEPEAYFEPLAIKRSLET
jgi:hypothetical protein